MPGNLKAFFMAFLTGILWLPVPVKSANYILVAVDPTSGLDGGIYIYPGDGDSINASTPSPGLTTVGMASIDINSMDVNIAEGTIYFLDRGTECIYRFSIDTNNVTTVRCGVSRSVYSTIAYDWISRNIYWTDGFFNWIAVQPADTTDRSMYRVIIQNDIEKPRALTVDPIAGFLFWYDINPSGYRIERASLDGSHRTLVITSSLLSVHDIETDPVNMRIYWTDAKKYTIESSKYDGSDRRIIYKRVNMFFRSISIDMDYVCSTVFGEQSWRCIKKSTGAVKLTRFHEFSSSNPKLISVFKQEMKPTMTDNCPTLGCEHFCVKLSSISTCMCKEGYTMDSSGVCQVNNHLYGKGVFLCNATNICMFDYRATTSHAEPLLCLSNMVQDCRHLTMGTSTGTIFYADSVANTINRYDLTTNVIGSLTVATDVSGLTFDWTDGNLYWTEATSGQVKAYSITTNADVVISESALTPSLITVDPHSRSLFWVEDTGDSSMRIMFKSLADNSSPQVLRQSTTSNIRSLFYDITSDRLFYVDGNALNTTTRNGSYGTSFPFKMDNVNQMVVYKRYVIWFSDTGYLNSISTQFFLKQQTSLPMAFGTVMGMTVYDPNLQHSSISACKILNGGCEHMCFTGPTGYAVCSCSYGFVLQPDKKVVLLNFILAPDFANGIIYQVSTVDASVNALDIKTAQRPLGVVYERKSSYVYWADIKADQIIRASLDGTNEQVVFTSDADSYPTLLALDSSTGNIYASIKHEVDDSITGSIIVLQPSTKRVKTIVENLQTVNGLALFPSKGIMFYINGNGSSFFIIRASMDGTNPRAIVTLPNEGYITLTIDYATEKLYWSSSRGVSYSDLTGQNEAVLFNDVKDILAIQILENYLFYTSHFLNKIVKYDLLTGMEVPFMSDNAEMGIIYTSFIHPRPLQSESSACSANNYGCSALCIPRETNSVIPCACPDGINPKPGAPHMCENDILCEDGVTNGMFSSPCGNLVQEACTFQCHPGFISAIPNSTLTCKANGQWSGDPQTVCENKCPAASESDNGRLWTSCQRTIEESCQYDCFTGYTKNFDVITCTEGNIWSPALADMCSVSTATIGDVQKRQGEEQDNATLAYAGISGVAGLLLVAFIIIVITCFVKRRFRKQMNTNRNPDGTTTTNIPESSRHEMVASGVFSDMRDFNTGSPLPAKESLPDSSETTYPDPHTWDTLCDAVPFDIIGESSDFDFDVLNSYEEQNSFQPFSLLRQTPPVSPERRNSPTGDQIMRRIASESAMPSYRVELDIHNASPPPVHTEMPAGEKGARPRTHDPKGETHTRKTPSQMTVKSSNTKPEMRRVASAVAMKVPTEVQTLSGKPPLHRTTSVASMRTVLEEPTIRETTSALLAQSSTGASNRRRSSVVTSLGDQLITRRPSEVSLETQSRRTLQKRRASVACIPFNSNEQSNQRRSSTTTIQSLPGDRQNSRRSSVISVKMAFGDQSENCLRSSISEAPSESSTRRASVAPVETVEVEDDVFEA